MILAREKAIENACNIVNNYYNIYDLVVSEKQYINLKKEEYENFKGFKGRNRKSNKKVS